MHGIRAYLPPVMQVRRSLYITLLSSNASALVMFALTLVLARLLTPDDIGVFSVTVVFINVVAVFRDFGAGPYLVREKDLTPEKIRSVLGLLLATSWVLAVALVLASGPIAAYYRQPAIADVLHVLTLSFLLVPYASVLSSLLMRDMQAGKTAIVTAASTAVYAATCLLLAWLDFGPLALAWANTANLVTNIIGFYLVRPAGTPLRPAFHGWREPMRFGRGAIAGNLLTVTHAALPDLVLGKVQGTHEVGLYSRANGLVGLFQQVVGPAISYNALPFISQHHHASTPLAPLLARTTSYLTGLAWPAYLVIGVFAEPIVRLLYGPTWVEAVPLVPILCVAAAVRIGYSLSQPALLAIGRPYLMALSVGSNLAARVLMLWWLGSADLWTFALALCIADVVSLPVPAWLMARHLGFPLRASLAAHGHSLAVTLACAGTAWLLSAGLPAHWPPAATVPVVSLGCGLTWLAAVIALRHPLREELERLVQPLGRALQRR
jgi:O-antigen/teichoic acid export membrane protein